MLKHSRSVNPFAESKQIEKILTENEKNFWGKEVCWSDLPRLI